LKQKNGKKTNFDENFLRQTALKAGGANKFEDDKSFKNDNRSVNKMKQSSEKK
jgi:hypothetical protein